MRAWEFTGEIKEYQDRMLHRIRAKIEMDFSDGTHVSIGEIGGWIEDEDNLQDMAWVGDSAMVYDLAIVRDSALVRDSAVVRDSALVYDSAIVCDSALVCGFARVYDSAIVCDSARIYDSASIRGSAMIGGSAEIYGLAIVRDLVVINGSAQVCDEARVYGSVIIRDNARVGKSAAVYGSARICGEARINTDNDLFIIGPIGSRNDIVTFFKCADDCIHVKCGCFHGTIDEFRMKVKKTHGNNHHAKNYFAAADLAEMKMAKENDDDKG